MPPAARVRFLDSPWRAGAITVVIIILGLVACRWRSDTGLTSLIRFGADLAPTQLPEIRALPVETAPNDGYDGQFYAQLAVSPDLHRPELATAVPNPSYRARRMLLPWIAHVLGFGRPWWVLHAYALLNVVAWLTLAWIWARECTVTTGAGFVRWIAGMLSLGALDSVRMALTDLPATLLIIVAVRLLHSARPRLAAVALACSGLIRETAILSALTLRPASGETRRWFPAFQALLWRAVIFAPAVAWSLWLKLQFPDAPANAVGNFDWPGFAWVRHLARCAGEIGAGNFDSRYTFGLLAALGLAWQSIFLLVRWRTADPWIRAALPFAALFWCLGDFVWHGYWAVARVVLPMTFVYARVAPLGWPFVLANAFLLHGLYRLLPDL